MNKFLNVKRTSAKFSFAQPRHWPDWPSFASPSLSSSWLSSPGKFESQRSIHYSENQTERHSLVPRLDLAQCSRHSHWQNPISQKWICIEEPSSTSSSAIPAGTSMSRCTVHCIFQYFAQYLVGKGAMVTTRAQSQPYVYLWLRTQSMISQCLLVMSMTPWTMTL